MRRLAAGAGPETLRRHRFDQLLAAHRLLRSRQQLRRGVDGDKLLRLGLAVGLRLLDAGFAFAVLVAFGVAAFFAVFVLDMVLLLRSGFDGKAAIVRSAEPTADE